MIGRTEYNKCWVI